MNVYCIGVRGSVKSKPSKRQGFLSKANFSVLRTATVLPQVFFEKGALIGVIALEYVDSVNRMTEIGYWLSAEAEGKGLILKTCPTLIDYAFRTLNLNRVQIRCASENIRSRAIPEKLGFRQEGILRRAEKLHDRYVDLIVYGMLADEWKPI